ncbi:MAG: DUF4190 domain-containing protein [Candidatus Nomurabacteria bacterium]|jgi:hypothetical protein|nr:DUF4190 domain-containing protein [Candidatus Nomurabacteria bacterium]
MEKTKKTNTMAIVGFVLSFFSSVIGIVLSIVALGQIKKTGEGGKGLATAGIIIGSVSTVVAIVVVVLTLVFSLGAIDKSQLYRDAVQDVNSSVSSYNRLLSIETISADPDDADAMSTAAANDAAKIREVVSAIEAKIDELAGNKIFAEDAEAKSLYDKLVTKFSAFKQTYNHAADIYERLSTGDTAAATELSTVKLTADDINSELNALNRYLVGKANNP